MDGYNVKYSPRGAGSICLLLLFGLALSVATGCMDEDSDDHIAPDEELAADDVVNQGGNSADEQAAEEEETAEKEPAPEGYAQLPPSAGGDAGCGEPPPEDPDGEPEEPDICTWLASPELVVMGEIAALKPSEYMILQSQAVEENHQYIDRECEGFTTLGFEVEMNVEAVLGGELDDDTLTFEIPMNHVDTWYDLLPTVGDNGHIEWELADEDPLAEGTVLGAMLFKNEDAQVWTTVQEPLFTVVEDDGEKTMRREGRYCRPDIPSASEMREWTLSQFTDQITECIETAEDSPEIQERRAQRKSYAERVPKVSHGSLCVETQPAFPSYCATDDDCESQEDDGGVQCGDDGRCG